jgi:hypothetical protein
VHQEQLEDLVEVRRRERAKRVCGTIPARQLWVGFAGRRVGQFTVYNKNVLFFERMGKFFLASLKFYSSLIEGEPFPLRLEKMCSSQAFRGRMW